MIFYITIIISIIGLIIATYTDLKSRIVKNKLNFSLAIIGLIIYGIQSLLHLDITPFLYSLFGLFFGFLFGWVLWKLGVFAGGDVKLFMALGALNPFTPALLKLGIFTNSSLPIFPITLFIYSLFAFFPYGIIILLYKLKKNKVQQKIIFADIRKKTKRGIEISFFIAALHIILGTLIPIELIIVEIITILVLGAAWGFLRKKKIFATTLSIIIALLINPIFFIQTLIGTLIVVVGLYGILKLLFSMKPLLSSKINITDLEEGMIPGKSLVWKGKTVVEVEELSVSKIIAATRAGKLKELFKKKDEIISTMKARGLNDDELKLVKDLSKKGLIGKEMYVKDSIPFVPTIFISYLLCLIFGDALLLVFILI